MDVWCYATIFILQRYPQHFNKATMMNAGFQFARKYMPDMDCIIFHDVDTLPEDDRNLYACYKTPRHVAVYLDKFGYG